MIVGMTSTHQNQDPPRDIEVCRSPERDMAPVRVTLSVGSNGMSSLHLTVPEATDMHTKLGTHLASLRLLDQAPAADPALDALDRLERNAASNILSGSRNSEAAATIRDALADRITQDEARILQEWARSSFKDTDRVYATADADLYARLGRIADRETGREIPEDDASWGEELHVDTDDSETGR